MDDFKPLFEYVEKKIENKSHFCAKAIADPQTNQQKIINLT